MDKNDAQGEVNTQNPQPTSDPNDSIISQPQTDQTILPEAGTTSVPTELPETKPSNVKKFILIAFIFLLVLGLFAAGVYWYLNLTSKSINSPLSQEVVRPIAFKATVTYVEGMAWKIVDGRRVEIKENDVLSESDTILTDEGGKLVLLFDEGSTLRLSENTKISLSELKAEKMSIREDAGSIFARVEKSANHEFIILADDVSVVSLGTAFAVEVEDEVKVSVFESSVKVTKGDTEVQIAENSQWSESEDVEDIDNKLLASNEFVNWSLSEEKIKIEPTKSPTKAPTKTPEKESESGSTGITLKATISGMGIKLSWSVSGVNTDKGFKVIRNQSETPVYPGNAAVYQDANVREYLWGSADGKSWKYRVCQYNGEGACGVYSNVVTITSPTGENSDLKSITLNGSLAGGRAELNWSIEGTSPLGFKIVYSLNSSPVFPPKEGDWYRYFEEAGTRSGVIESLEAGKTYHFRVCEYLGGKCGIYSNEITLSY